MWQSLIVGMTCIVDDDKYYIDSVVNCDYSSFISVHKDKINKICGTLHFGIYNWYNIILFRRLLGRPS